MRRRRLARWRSEKILLSEPTFWDRNRKRSASGFSVAVNDRGHRRRQRNEKTGGRLCKLADEFKIRERRRSIHSPRCSDARPSHRILRHRGGNRLGGVGLLLRASAEQVLAHARGGR